MSINQRLSIREYLKRNVKLGIDQERIKFVQLLENLQGEY